MPTSAALMPGATSTTSGSRTPLSCVAIDANADRPVWSADPTSPTLHYQAGALAAAASGLDQPAATDAGPR